MAQQPVSQLNVESIDPVWKRIREEAEEILADDPSLGGFIYSSILNHTTFEKAVCWRIAQRLHHIDVPSELIIQAFQDALDADPTIGEMIRADIIATEDRDPACHRFIDPVLYFKGFQAVQAYRMAHQLWKMGRKDFAFYIQSRVSLTFSIDIHPAAKIGRGIMIDHAHSIVIGENSRCWRQRLHAAFSYFGRYRER